MACILVKGLAELKRERRRELVLGVVVFVAISVKSEFYGGVSYDSELLVCATVWALDTQLRSDVMEKQATSFEKGPCDCEFRRSVLFDNTDTMRQLRTFERIRSHLTFYQIEKRRTHSSQPVSFLTTH